MGLLDSGHFAKGRGTASTHMLPQWPQGRLWEVEPLSHGGGRVARPVILRSLSSGTETTPSLEPRSPQSGDTSSLQLPPTHSSSLQGPVGSRPRLY